MAEVEEYGDFGSHFLDSMLEVQMTEEDGEVNVVHSGDTTNNRELPPIPTFDLESESFSDMYRNALVQKGKVLKPVAAVTVPGNTVTIPVKPSTPSIVMHSNMLKASSVTFMSNSIATAVQTVLSNNKKNPVLNETVKKVEEPQESPHAILKRIFKPEYVKKVFTKKEDGHDISKVNPEEEQFYGSAFKDVSKVQFCKLHCTICGKHLGCSVDVEKNISVHNMLKVLTCKECYKFYGDGNFPCDDNDHYEVYCRWCGQGGALICCSFCPKVFCKKCVRRNFDQAYMKAIEKASDWACFICAQKPLWPLRAVCRALLDYVKIKKSNKKLPSTDTCVCCKHTTLKKKPQVTDEERSKVVGSGGQTALTNQKDHSSANGTKYVLNSTPKFKSSDNGSIVLNNSGVGIKTNDQKKSPSTAISKMQQVVVSPNASKKSVPLNSIPSLASIPRVALINTPVYHGQTLITPPAARMSSSQKRGACSQNMSQSVKVSVTDSVNININKIPVAKIPSSSQGVILRLNFPDNKVQLIRVMTDEKGNDQNGSFPMPSFDNGDNLDFLEESLEDSFKLTKMLYERLTKIKERLSSKTRFTKQSVYKSSVKKLSFIYEKARELMKELDDNLIRRYENWRYEEEQEVNVVDVSDDEPVPESKEVQCQNNSPSGNAKKSRISDVEPDLECTASRSSMRNLRRVPKRNNNYPLTDSVTRAPKRKVPVSRTTTIPEVIDLNKFPQNSRRNSRPGKRSLPMEDESLGMQISDQSQEKDPLAISDHEDTDVRVNGEAGSTVDSKISVKTDEIVIKDEEVPEL